MAEHATGPAEVGAPMDYAEHEKTYRIFLSGAKYGTMAVVALLIAMAVYFFTAAGFISGFLLFIVLCAVGGYILR